MEELYCVHRKNNDVRICAKHYHIYCGIMRYVRASGIFDTDSVQGPSSILDCVGCRNEKYIFEISGSLFNPPNSRTYCILKITKRLIFQEL